MDLTLIHHYTLKFLILILNWWVWKMFWHEYVCFAQSRWFISSPVHFLFLALCLFCPPLIFLHYFLSLLFSFSLVHFHFSLLLKVSSLSLSLSIHIYFSLYVFPTHAHSFSPLHSPFLTPLISPSIICLFIISSTHILLPQFFSQCEIYETLFLTSSN